MGKCASKEINGSKKMILPYFEEKYRKTRKNIRKQNSNTASQTNSNKFDIKDLISYNDNEIIKEYRYKYLNY